MSSIYQQHDRIIDSYWARPKKENAEAHTAITKEWMKKFAEWCFKNYTWNGGTRYKYKKDSSYHDIEELIEIFLKQEEEQ